MSENQFYLHEKVPSSPEQPHSRIEVFTDHDRETLLRNGALIYRGSKTTIDEQKEVQTAKGQPSFGRIDVEGENLKGVRSLPCELAIFPDARFFIAGTFGKDLKEQEIAAEKDTLVLMEELGLENTAVIIPDEAATLSDITFQHFDATGEWLFGEKFAEEHGLMLVLGRTKDPTNLSGSFVANVGNSTPEHGLYIDGWYFAVGDDKVGVVRLLAPVENR